MATRPKAVIESRNGEKLSPITIAKNVLTDDGQNLHDILSDRKEDMMTPTIENSSSMFKVGQGDNVDYSSNVINGAYESVVLKGKTMVNCIQEPSSQDVVLPYEFADGQYVTINDTKESGALGVELKGQTLVNISEINRFSINGPGKTLYTTKKLIKDNTTYTRIIYISKNTLTGVNERNCVAQLVEGSNTIFSHDIQIALNETGLICNETFNSGTISSSKKNTSAVRVFTVNTGGVLEGYEIILEGDYTNVDIPYFKGMASCKMPVLHTVGKNLFDLSNASNGFLSTNEPYVLQSPDQNNKTSAYIKVKPNTKYSYSFDGFTPSQVGNMYWTGFYYYKRIGEVSAVHPSRMTFTSNSEANKQITFTTPSDCNYIRIGSRGLMLSGATAQLEEATSATAYELYKTSILSLPEEVVLRSLPNGVCDTYNVQTGEYVQNIGEVMFDGSNDEDWFLTSETGFTNKRFRTIILNGKMAKHIYEAIDMKIDRIACYPNSSWSNDREGAERDSTYLSFRKNIETIGEFKQWLSQNPVTVQYPLKTPIITKIPLSQVLKSWNTTTHIYSEIPENTLYPILSHLNPTYPVILKPSTKYSIVANLYSNNHTNSTINFNLGGATASTTVGNRVTTITTPSTLSNELLTMSGRGNKLNNVMVIEGDIVGDEPYFEGICDCKSPILSNVGGKDLNTSKSFPYQGTSLSFNINNIVAGKTYYIYVDVESYNDANLPVIGIVNQEGNNWNTKMVNIPLGKSWIKLTTSTTNTISNVLRIHKKDGLNDWIYVNNIMVFEEEDYKSNILSCNGDKIELTEDMFEQGGVYFTKGQSFANATNNTAPDRIRLKTLLNLKPNTTYRVAIDNAYKVGVQLYNNEKLAVSDSGWVTDTTFTTKGGEKFVALVIRKLSSAANISMSDFKNIKLQLSEVDKTIVLRSLPNGVCDTLNVETGEYVQRIGELVLDGSEQGWILGTSANWYADGDTFGFYFNDFKLAQGTSLCIDKFLSTPNIHSNDMEGCYINTKWSWVGVRIYKTKLPSLTVDAFKQWLSQNHITIQYRLATPIVKTVDLSGFPYAYANGHVQLSSSSIEQSLTPKVEYSVVTNRNGQIRSNQKMVERQQKQLDRLQAMILTNLVNTQYEQTLTNLKYDLKNVREEVK